MKEIQIVIIILIASLSVMCLEGKPTRLTPTPVVTPTPTPTPTVTPEVTPTPIPTPFQPLITPTPHYTVTPVEEPDEEFVRQSRIVALADLLHNSNWSFYYPDEDPFVWDEKTAALKLKPILERIRWSDGESVVGVNVCYNTTANKTFLLVNLSWGEQIIVEPVVDERYKNWSLYLIGSVHGFEYYPYRCDEMI